MRCAFMAAGFLSWGLLWACSKEAPPSAVDAGAVSGVDAGTDAQTLPYPLTQVCAPPTDAATPCALCRQARCCQSLEKILPTSADPLIECMIRCDDAGAKPKDDCKKRCLENDPHQADYLEHVACLVQNCPECGDGNPCTTCMSRKCPLEALACSLEPACVYMTACIEECPEGDTACVEGCYRKHSAAKTTMDYQTFCAQARCSKECTRKR